MSKSYSEIPHYWTVGIIPENSTSPVYGGCMAEGTDFDNNLKLEDEEVTGHTGTKTLKLDSERVSMTAEPEYECKPIFGQLFEDYFYMLLGSSTVSEAIPLTDANSQTLNAYNWTFYQDILNPKPLPRSTIINGYNVVENGVSTNASLYDNALMSEFEIKISDKGMTLAPKWVSNAPLIDQPNPARVTQSTWSRLGTEGLHVYIADYGTGLDTADATALEAAEVNCLLSFEDKFETNPSEDACLGNAFGTSQADEGEFSDKGKMEMKWNQESRHLINKWYAGSSTGTKPTTDSCFQELYLVFEGKTLGTTTAPPNTVTKEKFSLYYPKILLSKSETTESGDGTKPVKLEFNIVQDGTKSAITAKFTSKLQALHFGTAA